MPETIEDFDDGEKLFMTQAMETEAAEELALRLGPEAHKDFVELRSRLQEMTEGIEHDY